MYIVIWTKFWAKKNNNFITEVFQTLSVLHIRFFFISIYNIPLQTCSKIVLFLNEDKSRKIPFQKTDIKKLTKDFIDKYFQNNAKNKINFKTLNSPPPRTLF